MSSLAQIRARQASRKRASSSPAPSSAVAKPTADSAQSPGAFPAAAEASNAGAGPAKRWRRKGEVDAAAAAAYRACAASREAAREAARAAAAAEEDTVLEKERERLRKRARKEVGVERRAGRAPLGVDEVFRRLRALGRPVTLFGEGEMERWGRLREEEMKMEAEGPGQKNLFQDKMREMEMADRREMAHEYAGAEGPGKVGKVEEEGEVNCREDYVLRQLKRLVGLWEGDVASMSTEVRRTKDGRFAAVTLEQTKAWLAPLYKKLRRRRVAAAILGGLVDIFRAVEEREYVKANSAYYEKLAIGNAPWPMGATNVGIHARAAREKIGEDKIAHVMNDEESRKYIQAVKRLVSLCQKHYPNVPSKMISS